jgi:hypothetical protein
VVRLPHFGEVSNVSDHISRVRTRLERWGTAIQAGQSEEDFVTELHAALAEEAPLEMAQAFPAMPYPTFAQSYAGVKRYYDKQREAAAR